MKILLLGKNGMLGSDINSVISGEKNLPFLQQKSTVISSKKKLSFRPSSLNSYCTLNTGNACEEILPTAWDLDDLNITDKFKVFEKITDLQPDIIINAAAYTEVDRCENKKDLAFDVNGYGVKYLAQISSKIDAKLIHFSTDYVFDGKNKDGYDEDNKPNPINVYGESKLLGENFIREIMGEDGNYAIIRISFLFGENGDNFVKKILNLSSQKALSESELGYDKSIRVVDTQISCPTYTKDLAKRIPDFFDDRLRGIFHITNNGAVSKYEFTKEIIKQKGLDINFQRAYESEFPTPAKRPAFSVLKNNKIDSLRDYKDALNEYLLSFE